MKKKIAVITLFLINLFFLCLPVQADDSSNSSTLPNYEIVRIITDTIVSGNTTTYYVTVISYVINDDGSMDVLFISYEKLIFVGEQDRYQLL